MRSRNGFTLLELLMVLIIAGIAAGIAIPQVGQMMAHTRVQRAASVLAADIRLAHSMAGRQRHPMRIVVDEVNQVFRVRDHVTPDVYSERRFNASGEYPVDSFVTTDAQVIVYPNGLSDGEVTFTLRVGAQRREVKLSRGGQVRLTTP